MMIRRVSRQVNVGNIKIGGDAPVAIQSMLNALASDFEGNLKQLKALEAFAAAADGKATKIIIPSEIQSLAGLATSFKEVIADK